MNNALLKIAEGYALLGAAIKELAIAETVKKNTEKEEIKNKEEEIIKLEQVRAVLATKSQSGKQPEVKMLIQKYGAEKLTALDPSCYKDLLKEAEGL